MAFNNKNLLWMLLVAVVLVSFVVECSSANEKPGGHQKKSKQHSTGGNSKNNNGAKKSSNSNKNEGRKNNNRMVYLRSNDVFSKIESMAKHKSKNETIFKRNTDDNCHKETLHYCSKLIWRKYKDIKMIPENKEQICELREKFFKCLKKDATKVQKPNCAKHKKSSKKNKKLLRNIVTMLEETYKRCIRPASLLQQ